MRNDPGPGWGSEDQGAAENRSKRVQVLLRVDATKHIDERGRVWLDKAHTIPWERVVNDQGEIELEVDTDFTPALGAASEVFCGSGASASGRAGGDEAHLLQFDLVRLSATERAVWAAKFNAELDRLEAEAMDEGSEDVQADRLVQAVHAADLRVVRLREAERAVLAVAQRDRDVRTVRVTRPKSDMADLMCGYLGDGGSE